MWRPRGSQSIAEAKGRCVSDSSVQEHVPCFELGLLLDRHALIAAVLDEEVGALPISRLMAIDSNGSLHAVVGDPSMTESDPLNGPVGPTDDVDVVISVASRVEYLRDVTDALHKAGFKPYLSSADAEDVVALVDGRPELIEEVRRSGPGIRAYLASELGAWLAHEAFRDLVEGFYRGDAASQARKAKVYERLRALGST
jgi:hypothetical protein